MENREKILDAMKDVAEQIGKISIEIEPYLNIIMVPLNDRSHRYLPKEESKKLCYLLDKQNALSEKFIKLCEDIDNL